MNVPTVTFTSSSDACLIFDNHYFPCEFKLGYIDRVENSAFKLVWFPPYGVTLASSYGCKQLTVVLTSPYNRSYHKTCTKALPDGLWAAKPMQVKLVKEGILDCGCEISY